MILDNAFPPNISDEVKDLVTHFLELSNAKSTHNTHDSNEDKLASLFLADGVYQFGPLVGRGHDGIKDLREKLFANIPHRKHPAVRIYTFGDDQMELMVLGKVEYKFHEGHGHDTDWTGRYSLGRDEDGTLKFKEMQIIMQPAHENEKSSGKAGKKA